jgi:chloramphenicol 3-O phosphotransferase
MKMRKELWLLLVLSVSSCNPVVIFLNGTSSSGKSSIAQAIQRQSLSPFIFHSINTMSFNCLDQKFFNQREWIGLDQTIDTNGNFVTTIFNGSKGDHLHATWVQSLTPFVQNGFNAVVEEVVFDKKIFDRYKKFLPATTQWCIVKVKCDLEEVVRREKNRNDRVPGVARGLYFVNDVIDHYDLEVDSTHASAEDNAKIILDFVSKNQKQNNP